MEEIKDKLKEVYEIKESAIARKKMYENNSIDYEQEYKNIIDRISTIKKYHNKNLLIIFITYVLSVFTNSLITIELSNITMEFKHSLFSILRIIVIVIPFISRISFYKKTKSDRLLLRQYTDQKYKLVHDIFDNTNLLKFCNQKILLCDESINKLNKILINDKEEINIINCEEIKENNKTLVKKIK